MEDKKYYSSLQDKQSALERKAKKQQDFIKDSHAMKAQGVDIMDDTLQKDVNQVVSPEFREAKVDAYRKARRQALGKPVEEAVGDTLDYKQLRKQMSKMGKAAGRGLKMIPIIGSAAALLGSEDASAAIPGLDQAESLGPAPGSLEARLEDGTITPEEREELRKQALANFAKYRVK